MQNFYNIFGYDTHEAARSTDIPWTHLSVNKNEYSNEKTLEGYTSNPATVGERAFLKVSQSNGLKKEISVTKIRGKSACCQPVAGILKGKAIKSTQSDRVRGP